MASHHLKPVVSSDFSSKIGRNKLMLRLPAVRQTLQRLGGDPIDELAEAYDAATNMLESLRKNRAENVLLLNEYQALCDGIELDVLTYCHSTKR
ncbi:hypothetical protein F9K79_17255 [Ochrobactrum sp. Kaboul]|nr:hypothetical protein F9K79_17255 [Ochrobactrum sp. Kaboul]